MLIRTVPTIIEIVCIFNLNFQVIVKCILDADGNFVSNLSNNVLVVMILEKVG